MPPAPKRLKNSDAPEVTAKYYLTNSKLLPAVIRAKAEGKLTNELAEMLVMLAKKYSMKPCFSGYTYREDMVAEALANLCQNALKFNPERSDNPFAFYTTCITNSFLHILKNEKKHRRIRDQFLIEMGENPSFNFLEEAKNHGVDQSDITDLTSQIAEAKERIRKENELEAAKAALEAVKAVESGELEDEKEDLELMISDEDIIEDQPKSLLNF